MVVESAMKKVLITLAIAVALLATSCRGESAKYRTAGVERGDIVAVVNASGPLQPLVSVQVGSQVSGRIKEIYVDAEYAAKKDQLLARIDPAPFESKVKQARANLEIARAKVVSAEAKITETEAKVRDTQRIYGRLETLFKEGVATEQERDTSKANYDMAVATLESAKAQLELAQAELEQAGASLESAELDLSYTYIYSPIDGVVLTRMVDVGQTVAATFQTPTLFVIAQDLSEMEAYLDVNEADVGRLSPAQPATFYVSAYPNMTFEAEVTEIRSSPEVVQNVVTYDVVIGVGNKELKLKPGMTANATIIVGERKDVLKIPNAALRFRPPKENNMKNNPPIPEPKGAERLVYTLKGKKLIPIVVVTGLSDDRFTELVRGDLKEGDQVVISMAGSERSPRMPRRIF